LTFHERETDIKGFDWVRSTCMPMQQAATKSSEDDGMDVGSRNSERIHPMKSYTYNGNGRSGIRYTFV
jgi:hypothetical protein